PGKGTLKPVIERDMDALRALGIHVPAGRMPEIFLQTGEMKQSRDRLDRMHLPEPILAIGLGASRPSKSWPVDRFASLAYSWTQKTGGAAIAIVSHEEEPLAHEFLKSVDEVLTSALPEPNSRAKFRARITVQAGRPLRELAGLLKYCSVFAGNDSGP